MGKSQKLSNVPNGPAFSAYADAATSGYEMNRTQLAILTLSAAALVGIAQHEAAYKAGKDAEQAKSVRQQRGEKLKDSDWTQVIDAPVDQAAWATYRQALRDISGQEGFPWNVTWPTEPQ